MVLADYYRANAEDESKLFVYIVYGDSTLPAKFKDCVITVLGKTLEEAKQRWDRLINNNLIEEDKEIILLDYAISQLNNYTNFRIKKHKVEIREDGIVVPLMHKEVIDEEMTAYENERVANKSLILRGKYGLF